MDTHTSWLHMRVLACTLVCRAHAALKPKCTVISCQASAEPIARGVVIVGGARPHP